MTVGAQRLVDEITARGNPHVRDWLQALYDRFPTMLSTLVPGLDRNAVVASLKTDKTAAALDTDVMLNSARAFALSVGKEKIAERDIAAAVMRAAGYTITLIQPAMTTHVASPPAPPVSPLPVAPPVAAPSPSVETAQPATPQTIASPAAPAGGMVSRAPVSVPTLEKFGRDLTRAALEGKLQPVVGRTAEIETVMETLCRRTKRNPLLVGPAGTGKTAIIEGLAQRIANNDVPNMLKGVRLFSLQPSSLVAGAGIVGELEKRMGAILQEAAQDGVLIFIDEVHAIMGAGGREGTGDMSSMLKPALARGDIACIAATTSDEYRKFVENDRALERRFQPIRIEELTPAQTLDVLKRLRNDFAKDRGIDVGDDVLSWLVDVAKQFMPNRNFPDKGVDLLDQTVAYGVINGLTKIERPDAEKVVRRMLGIPSIDRIGLDQMRAGLIERGLLEKIDADKLVERLEVTSRGLDVRAARPNAVMMLAGDAAESAEAIASIIAQGAYGSSDRVVRVDLGRLDDDEDSNVLLGSPPGYIGYTDRHALDALAEMPWSVLVLERADLCHPMVRGALAPGLVHGVLTDMRGRRIYFSDAIVLVTVGAADRRAARTIGFGSNTSNERRTDDGVPEAALGKEFADAIDLVFWNRPATAESGDAWITTQLLPQVAAKHRERGIDIEWHPSVVEWLSTEWHASRDPQAVERQVENQIGSALVRELYRDAVPKAGRCVVKRNADGVIVERSQEQ